MHVRSREGHFSTCLGVHSMPIPFRHSGLGVGGGVIGSPPGGVHRPQTHVSPGGHLSVSSAVHSLPGSPPGHGCLRSVGGGGAVRRCPRVRDRRESNRGEPVIGVCTGVLRWKLKVMKATPTIPMMHIIRKRESWSFRGRIFPLPGDTMLRKEK